MSNIIEAIKAYVTTPEGLEWFSETMNKATLHHSQKNQEQSGIVTRKQLEQKWDKEVQARKEQEEKNAPLLHVSRQDVNLALQIGDSFYIHESQDEKYHLKSIHLAPSSRFDARFVSPEQVKAIVSDDVHMLRVSPGEPGVFRVTFTD